MIIIILTLISVRFIIIMVIIITIITRSLERSLGGTTCPMQPLLVYLYLSNAASACLSLLVYLLGWHYLSNAAPWVALLV